VNDRTSTSAGSTRSAAGFDVRDDLSFGSAFAAGLDVRDDLSFGSAFAAGFDLAWAWAWPAGLRGVDGFAGLDGLLGMAVGAAFTGPATR
jgi:hypothetical protein